ncbi:protein of unknown function [Taphrina deformans PYCC 5710]|uniref:RRM domain-containing protein n=1 Tax=Taphrina deformans (strain PYCC 5710 / ATCC 11124 / CBS 356.35 / IMI 108563 / JCM 9778 / NBRC 8474) TaxID=1097556 RepID=R4XFL6_TAPDE|nr:protein of unknown function [Taphrina deformans PYCC 5710]|eukprot:CCG84556.1 protein of unknown function [Taphrina deformans PYCC 5710]
MFASKTCRRLVKNSVTVARTVSTEAPDRGSTQPQRPDPVPDSVPLSRTSGPPSRRADASAGASFSPDRFEGSRRPTQDTKIIHCLIHGTTASFSDITRLLSQGGYRGRLPRDYVLRRGRRERATYLTLEFDSVADASSARIELARQRLNGRPISTHRVPQGRLPPKYDPLHVAPQSGPGKVVSIEGLPYTATEDRLRTALAGYELVDNMDFQIFLLRRVADLSIWLVRLKSEDEAQRLVRNVNCTYYRRRQSGDSFPIKAEVFH